MARNKFYSVRKGRQTGIFTTWPDAQKQVSGFPGAEYKSFTSKEEAEAFLDKKENSTSSKTSTSSINASIEKEISTLSPKKAIAFIDGSYGKVKERAMYSFGAVIITDKREVELYRSYLNPDWIAYRNVAGEIQGAMEAISWARDHGKAEIDVYYDYQGIEKWAIGDWRANSAVAIAYVKFIQKVKEEISIRFFHVPAHTGVDYNERVDDLAKFAQKSQNFRTHNAMSLYFTNLTQADWVSIYETLQAENQALGDLGEIKAKTEETGKDYLHRIVLVEGSEEVIVNLYGRDKAYVEGHPDSAFYQRVILLAIGQMKSAADVLNQMNRLYQGKVEKEAFDFAVERLLPNISDKELDGTLWSAVYGYLFQGYMADYTPLFIPIYRSLKESKSDAPYLNEIETIYSNWKRTSTAESSVSDLNEVREMIQDGLHLLNN